VDEYHLPQINTEKVFFGCSWALFSKNFLIERVPSWPILKFWDFDRLGEMAMSYKLKITIALRPFQMSPHHNSDSRNSSHDRKVIFILVKVQVKARFLDL
jgi:hypothetical protein